MATSFPSGLDALTNPTSSDGLNSPDHAGQHANANDAIEALEAKVGVNGSAVTSSLDYMVAASKVVTDKVDPASASTNQVLKFNGTKFVPATGASVTVSDTPPTSPTPQAGDQWYESDTGRQLIYYDGFWVEIGSTATTNVNANDLSGTVLASNVVSSSLTSVGTIANLQATAATINGWTVSQPGLVLVKTQTVGTAVSSVTVSDAFSSTYDNYRIIYTGGNSSVDNDLKMTLGASASGYYAGFAYVAYTSGTVTGISNNNATSWANIGSQRTVRNSLDVDLFGPFMAIETGMAARYFGISAGAVGGGMGGFHNATTQHTAFTITCTSGNITGGTIRVYGYRNS